MSANNKPPADSELTPDDLAAEDAAELPDREAMSIFDLGGLTSQPLPLNGLPAQPPQMGGGQYPIPTTPTA